MQGICHEHLRHHLVRPTLTKYDLWTQAREEIVIMTAAHESMGGYWLVQLNGGPARGIYQMEPPTYHDIRTIVVPNPRIQLDFDIPIDPDYLIWDLRLATVMCCLQYWRHKEPLPPPKDIDALAKYYKKYYNSALGKASVDKVARDYYDYTRGEGSNATFKR